MTKEELEKEAEIFAIKSYGNDAWTQAHIADTEIDCIRMYIVQGYLAGAEPREKQIQIDAEQIRALQKQNGELTDKVKELEAQIDKLTKELDEYKSIDKRLICNHKYFTSDIKNNNLAVICHSILDCDKCGRWEEE